MTSATQIQNSQDFYDNSPELYGHFGLKNKNMFNYLKSYTSAYTDSVDVTTHDPIIVKPIVKPPQTKEGINILIVLAIVALLIVFLAALTVILWWCWKTNKVIPPQIKDMLNRTYSQKSTELELELSNPDIDSEKLNDVFIDVVNSNEDNYLILQEMGEDEKKIYVPQASQVFTDLQQLVSWSL